MVVSAVTSSEAVPTSMTVWTPSPAGPAASSEAGSPRKRPTAPSRPTALRMEPEPPKIPLDIPPPSLGHHTPDGTPPVHRPWAMEKFSRPLGTPGHQSTSLPCPATLPSAAGSTLLPQPPAAPPLIPHEAGLLRRPGWGGHTLNSPLPRLDAGLFTADGTRNQNRTSKKRLQPVAAATGPSRASFSNRGRGE